MNCDCVFSKYADRRRKLALKHVEDILSSLFHILRVGTDKDIEQLRLGVQQAPLEQNPVDCLRNLVSPGNERKTMGMAKQG